MAQTPNRLLGPFNPWLYRARYHSVVDGDTLRLEVDLGFYTRGVHRVRLIGMNAPELYRGTEEEKAAGRASRQALIDWMQAEPGWDAHFSVPTGIRRGGWVFYVATQKDNQSFNRYLGVVWRVSDLACLNDDLVRSGHAVYSER